MNLEWEWQYGRSQGIVPGRHSVATTVAMVGFLATKCIKGSLKEQAANEDVYSISPRRWTDLPASVSIV